MAMFPVKPLDGADGYLRWKESVLLRLHSLDVAHVLSDEPPPEIAHLASKKWAREDALCRGHILAALSDHLLPVYVRHATGRALWQAVARTYEPDASSWKLWLEELEFREDETVRERVARAEALAIAGFPEYSDESRTCNVCMKLPDVAKEAIMHGDRSTMDGIWRTAQAMESVDNCEQAWEASRRESDRINSGYIAKRRRRSRAQIRA